MPNKINKELRVAIKQTLKKYGYTAIDAKIICESDFSSISIKSIITIAKELKFSDEDKLNILRKHTAFNDDVEYLKTLGLPKLLKQFRKNTGLTVEEFASKALCSNKTLENIENWPDYNLGKNLFVRIKTLFNGDPNHEPPIPPLENIRPIDIEILNNAYDAFKQNKHTNNAAEKPDGTLISKTIEKPAIGMERQIGQTDL